MAELSKETLRDVCKVGYGEETCRYVVAGINGIECAKLEERAKKEIDSRVAKGLFVAKGDNCIGIK
jgi:hypothetical protein